MVQKYFWFVIIVFLVGGVFLLNELPVVSCLNVSQHMCLMRTYAVQPSIVVFFTDILFCVSRQPKHWIEGTFPHKHSSDVLPKSQASRTTTSKF